MRHTGKSTLVTAHTLPLLLALLLSGMVVSGSVRGDEDRRRIELPEPRDTGATLAEALRARRSVRDYPTDSLTVEEVASLLWAAQGITESQRGFRTAPSAGATFPIEVYLVVGGNIRSGISGSTDQPESGDTIDAGAYRYLPDEHALELFRSEDLRDDLYKAALRQDSVGSAPAVIVITAITARTSRRYGARAERYIAMEAGHVSQNIYLQAAALDLGTVAIGAFEDDQVARVLGLSRGENPLYLMPVGRLRSSRTGR